MKEVLCILLALRFILIPKRMISLCCARADAKHIFTSASCALKKWLLTHADTIHKPFGLVGCCAFNWSTSHIPGRFPDLQIITCFSFSYSWVVQWIVEACSLLTVTSSSGILTLFPLQNPEILHLIQQYSLHT